MAPRRQTPAQLEAQRKKELAAERSRGRAEGARDALLLLGVGVGLGLARVLAPPRTGKCQKRPATLVWGACRLDENHEGACQPEGLFGP